MGRDALVESIPAAEGLEQDSSLRATSQASCHLDDSVPEGSVKVPSGLPGRTSLSATHHEAVLPDPPALRFVSCMTQICSWREGSRRPAERYSKDNWWSDKQRPASRQQKRTVLGASPQSGWSEAGQERLLRASQPQRPAAQHGAVETRDWKASRFPTEGCLQHPQPRCMAC